MPKVVAPIKYLDTCVIVRRSPGVVGNVKHSHDGVVVHYIALTEVLDDPAICRSRNVTPRAWGALGTGRTYSLWAQKVAVIIARAYRSNAVYAGGGM